MESGTAYEPGKTHLFVVCSDPCPEGLQVIAPITSYTNDLCDQTCLLNAHEHRFIRHKSYILYRKSRIEPAIVLAEGVIAGTFRRDVDLNAQTFLRVRNGICKSPQTPRKIKAYLGCEITAAAVLMPADLA